MTTYLIIEYYKSGKLEEIYKRFAEQGRMLPKGVIYIDSWVEINLQKCYQIMQSDSREKIDSWIEQWSDLVDFEVIHVLSSAEVSKRVR